MTPQEKAQDLIDHFLMIRNEYNENLYYTQAKQCALIAVDEILSSLWFKKDAVYWKEVKQHINEL